MFIAKTGKSHIYNLRFKWSVATMLHTIYAAGLQKIPFSIITAEPKILRLWQSLAGYRKINSQNGNYVHFKKKVQSQQNKKAIKRFI